MLQFFVCENRKLLKNLGIRVVYKLIKIDGQMLVVVIGARADDEVYGMAKTRADKHEI